MAKSRSVRNEKVCPACIKDAHPMRMISMAETALENWTHRVQDKIQRGLRVLGIPSKVELTVCKKKVEALEKRINTMTRKNSKTGH